MRDLLALAVYKLSIIPKKMRAQYSFCAIISNKKGDILSIGFNSYTKSHPVQYKYSKKFGMDDKIYLHAEIDALIQLKKQDPYKMSVARLTRNGQVSDACPCSICMDAIKASGIYVVEYTIKEKVT